MINEEFKDVFVEVFNTGIGRASDALSRLLDTFVELQKPIVHFFEYESIEAYSRSMGIKDFIAVSQEIEGAIDGTGIVSFPVTEGKTLVDVMLENQSSSSKDFDDMEIEAIAEVGNMVINSVASAVADMSSLMLDFRVPKALLSNTVIPAEFQKQGDLFCIAETQFSIKDLNISGYINLIFSTRHAEKIAEHVIKGL